MVNQLPYRFGTPPSTDIAKLWTSARYPQPRATRLRQTRHPGMVRP